MTKAPDLKYQIISRWPQWARFRKVTARPHGEKYHFDARTRELVFDTYDDAINAVESMKRANAGDYRVIPVLMADLLRPSDAD
jgi:hypothetical protein